MNINRHHVRSVSLLLSSRLMLLTNSGFIQEAEPDLCFIMNPFIMQIVAISFGAWFPPLKFSFEYLQNNSQWNDTECFTGRETKSFLIYKNTVNIVPIFKDACPNTCWLIKPTQRTGFSLRAGQKRQNQNQGQKVWSSSTHNLEFS